MKFCEIYVVSHKPFKVPSNPIYTPIQVGYNEKNLFDNGVRDNIGINIANKNANYCELTALYWIWKNVADVENVGLCHYRRYFVRSLKFKNEKNFLNARSIQKILEDYEIIVPKKMNIIKNVKSFYYVYGQGRKKDIDRMENIIKEKYPEYVPALEKVLAGHSAFYCNMMITSKTLYDAYCEWLFDILFCLEKVTDLSGYTREEARIYGYLSEILLNVWAEKNKLKIKYVPVVNTEYGYFRSLLRDIRSWSRGIAARLRSY